MNPSFPSAVIKHLKFNILVFEARSSSEKEKILSFYYHMRTSVCYWKVFW